MGACQFRLAWISGRVSWSVHWQRAWEEANGLSALDACRKVASSHVCSRQEVTGAKHHRRSAAMWAYC